jgi:hypothetical protein
MTDRDVFVLKVLRYGPLSFIQILAQLQVLTKNKHGDGFDDKVEIGFNQTVPSLPKGDKPLFSKSALRTSLRRLKKEKRIRNKVFGDKGGHGTKALYTITDKGADELYAQGVRSGTIRVVALPDRDRITHELMVTDTIRVANREANKLGFKIVALDHKALKSQNKNKRAPVEDILFLMKFPVTTGYEDRVLRVEIDNDTIRPIRIYRKCIRLKHITVFLCTVQSRIDELKNYIVARKKGPNDEAYENARTRAFFALINDFSANGFMGTTMTNCEGVPLNIIPANFVVKKKRTF